MSKRKKEGTAESRRIDKLNDEFHRVLELYGPDHRRLAAIERIISSIELRVTKKQKAQSSAA